MKKLSKKRAFTSKSKKADLEKVLNKTFSAQQLRKTTGLKGTKKEVLSKLNKDGIYNILNDKFPSNPTRKIITVLSGENDFEKKIQNIEKFRDGEISKSLKNVRSVRITFKRGYSKRVAKKKSEEGKEVPEYFEDFADVTPNNQIKTQKDLMEYTANLMELLKAKISDSLEGDEEPYNIREINFEFYYNK